MGRGAACKPGTTTWEINRVVHETITSRGATPSFLGLYGFPAAACISVNEELIHGIPDKKHLIKEGDIVSIDVGACIGGYHGDSAYTVGVGEIAPETKQLLEVTQECLNRGIAAALKGNRLAISARRCRPMPKAMATVWCANMWATA